MKTVILAATLMASVLSVSLRAHSADRAWLGTKFPLGASTLANHSLGANWYFPSLSEEAITAVPGIQLLLEANAKDQACVTDVVFDTNEYECSSSLVVRDSTNVTSKIELPTVKGQLFGSDASMLLIVPALVAAGQKHTRCAKSSSLSEFMFKNKLVCREIQ